MGRSKTAGSRQAKVNFGKNRILVKNGNAYFPLHYSGIALFYSSNKITFAVDFSGNKYTADETLSAIEGVVDPLMFFRISRQVILNIDAIKLFKIKPFGRISIELISANLSKEAMNVSQVRSPLFRQWVEQL